MTTDSIPIPANRVPPVASDMAGSSKTNAGVLFFVAAIVFIAMLGVLADGDKTSEKYGSDAEKAGEKVGQMIAVVLFGGLPGWFGFKAARNASRATRAGKVASTDPSYTFRLAGKFIIAADGAGVPHPELSFKINPKLRTMLLAVPHAEVVDKRG
jgi:hypothetical protein